ncbi:putative Zn finger protein [Paenibacillus sp. V4I3]|uniref:SWIM zinc finger family protein n=1 Tax=Paenibacillus sp. V4I3 TaxID=3042305 RepID=UPI002783AF46|nr:SWIM zinc finger family protein [Paenibacillus sp. V4I3]MDQ0873142.1 putative Zn finger protein [Paenibacillus sp. V4I3]
MLELKIDWDHWTERIRSYFDETILQRGWEYYTIGVVREVSTEGTSVIHARVMGSKIYKVHIDLKAFTRSSCSCPYGSYCKHMASVLFEVAKQEGYNTKELLTPSKAKVLTHPKFDLTPKKAVKLPKATDTCEEWRIYLKSNTRIPRFIMHLV